MSKQLTFASALSVIAVSAMALVMSLAEPAPGSRPATAHGSALSVLLGA